MVNLCLKCGIPENNELNANPISPLRLPSLLTEVKSKRCDFRKYKSSTGFNERKINLIAPKELKTEVKNNHDRALSVDLSILEIISVTFSKRFVMRDYERSNAWASRIQLIIPANESRFFYIK